MNLPPPLLRLRIVSTLFLALVLLFGGGAARAALISRLTFDEPAGTVARDSVGSAHGTLFGGASLGASGIANGALRLVRNQGGYVNLHQNFSFGDGSFSISVWIKTGAGDRSDSLAVVSKHFTGTENGYWINVNQTGSLGALDRAEFYQGLASDLPTSTTVVNDGQWHHLVATYDRDGQKCLYVDGVPAEDCAPSNPMTVNSAPFLVGAFSTGTTESGATGFFNGWIDELKIFDHVLSEAEIVNLLANPSGPSGESQVLILPEETKFTNSVSITMANQVGVGEVRFTTNGTPVTPLSTVYTQPILITNQVHVQAAVYLNGFIVSSVTAKSYERIYALDDGVPNEWRRQYFGARYATDPRVGAQEDPDRDGSNNLAEFLAGTDPLDPRAAFRATVRLVPHLSFPTQVGRKYSIWRKAILGSSEAVRAGTVTATGPTTTFIDESAQPPESYYFIEAMP